MAVVLYPTIAKMPAVQASDTLSRCVKQAKSVIGAAGGLVMLLGLARAYVGGQVSAWSDLLSVYSVLVALAFVLAVVLEARVAGNRRKFSALMDNADRFAVEAPRLARRMAWGDVILVFAILAIMIVLGLALY